MLQNGKGKRRFDVPPAIIEMMTGIYPYELPKVCTPAELIRRGASEFAAHSMSVVPSTGFELVKTDEVDIAALFNGGGK